MAPRKRTEEELWEFFRDVPTIGEAEAAGVAGGAITREEAVRRHLTKRGIREEEQAGKEALLAQAAAFERPEQVARIGEIGARTRKIGAEAGTEEYGLGFKKSVIDTVRDLLGQSKRKGELDIMALEKGLYGGLPGVPEEEVIPPAAAKPRVTPGVARPRRRLRPSVKKFLWEGYPAPGGIGRLPGLLAPAYGWSNISDWLSHFAKKGYEYAYPRER